ncbi:TonB-dependent receptor [Pedobacter sp. MC2016-14]|uniref:TonB-dependent receptor n=1 Tax=Pedobacter sp. MC2016-14 TaxID=2897327 RepID=UPI001E4ABF81|nr:carboxypeptidase-like regulatory domain-containing protein [Pedobacter sp. MC2016-14]MCD0489839.1 TonB-dependent receptor [Pedobacter sp. MC2016-14]
MKIFILTSLFLFTLSIGYTQVKISGTITSTRGNLIANVNIILKDSYDGATSDSKGQFEFTTLEKGPHTIEFSALNFGKDSVKVNIDSKNLILALIIKEEINTLHTVNISAGSFITGDKQKGAVLSSLDIATIAGARADVFAAMQTLPGAQTSFSESGLFVRGGAASETKTYFDGMLVKSAFNATVPDQASRGRLSPFLFKGTSFSAGGYSAQYGQALSSTLILESTDLPEKTTTGISLLTVGAGLDQNIRLKNSAITVGAYYYNLKPAYSVIKQQNQYIKAPELIGGNIQYKAKTSETGIFKFYASYAKTNLSLNSTDVNFDSVNYFSNNNTNTYINTSYKEYLNRNWKIEAGAAYNKDSNAGMMAVNSYSREDDMAEGRLTLTNYFGKLSNLKFGGEMFNTKRLESYNGLQRYYNDQLSSAFAETDLYLNANVVARLGLRAEYSSYLHQYNLAPRTSLGLKTGLNAQVSFAYGRFYQNPEDEYLIIKALEFEQAEHYILKYEINTPFRNFRIEGYYKNYGKLTKTTNGNLDNSGSGYAKGFELFWKDKKTISNIEYWFSYSFLDTKRNFRDFPALATPSFAAKHTATMVYKQFISILNTQVNATYTFASGRPYVNPNNLIYLADKTKSYNNLSLSLSYLTHVCKQFTVLYLNASNIPGFNNVYGYQYSKDGQNRKTIMPASKRDFLIGMLITIGDNTFVR